MHYSRSPPNADSSSSYMRAPFTHAMHTLYIDTYVKHVYTTENTRFKRTHSSNSSKANLDLSLLLIRSPHCVFFFSALFSLSLSLSLPLSLSLALARSFFPPTPRSLISLFLKDGFPRVRRKQRTDFWGTSCTTHVSQSAICRRRSCVNG